VSVELALIAENAYQQGAG